MQDDTQHTWTVKVNDASLPARVAVPEMQVLRIPLEPRLLRAGENSIVLKPTSGAISVGLDDYFDFGRTALYEPLTGWRTKRLDDHTYLRRRSLHIPNGEAAIVLELKE